MQRCDKMLPHFFSLSYNIDEAGEPRKMEGEKKNFAGTFFADREKKKQKLQKLELVKL